MVYCRYLRRRSNPVNTRSSNGLFTQRKVQSIGHDQPPRPLQPSVLHKLQVNWQWCWSISSHSAPDYTVSHPGNTTTSPSQLAAKAVVLSGPAKLTLLIASDTALKHWTASLTLYSRGAVCTLCTLLSGIFHMNSYLTVLSRLQQKTGSPFNILIPCHFNIFVYNFS